MALRIAMAASDVSLESNKSVPVQNNAMWRSIVSSEIAISRIHCRGPEMMKLKKKI